MTASRPDDEAIFHAARDIPDPDRRREYVREACGGDEPSIAHVEALLAAAAAPDSSLDHPPARGRRSGRRTSPPQRPPARMIGPYKLARADRRRGHGTV